MAVLDLPAFAAALTASGALIGLDPGSKRIGVALSDPARMIASPVEIIARKTFTVDSARLFALYDARACAGFVIGLPLNMDGSSGPSAQSARAFAGNLLKQRDLPILLWDERLTSVAANRALLEADASRKRRGELVDKIAASYMLQGALEALRGASA